MSIFMIFGGEIPNVDDGAIVFDDDTAISIRDISRVARSYIAVDSDVNSAVAFCKFKHKEGKLEWFEVCKLSGPQDTSAGYTFEVVYDDKMYEAELEAIREKEYEQAELKRITPESFILVVENGNSLDILTYPTLQATINALLLMESIRWWAVKSQPQDKYICKREGGFPGREVYVSRTAADQLNQLIAVWQDETARSN